MHPADCVSTVQRSTAFTILYCPLKEGMALFLPKVTAFIKDSVMLALAGIALLMPIESFSQDPLARPRLYVEGFGGASKYFGEFTDISFWIAGGINAWYRVNPQFSVGGSIGIGQTRFRVVNDATEYYSTPQVLARVTPLDILGRWNILPFETSTPYLTAGLGFVSFEVQSDIGQYIDLRRVNTETKAIEVVTRNTSLTNVFQYNLGIGYELMYSRNVTLGLFSRLYFPSTDLLDGIQYINSSNDAFLLAGFTGSFGVTSVTSMSDMDEDGVPDMVEESLGTNIDKTDTDGDGLSDFDELKYHSNPLRADTDEDNLSDRDEIEIFKTNPLSTDSDSDGLRDDEEIAQRTDPLKPDTDGDSFGDSAEIMLGLNPLVPEAMTPELIELTEVRSINGIEVRTAKSTARDIRFLKQEIEIARDELSRQKALLSAAENRLTQQSQPVSTSRHKNQQEAAQYQRRIDSLEYALATAAIRQQIVRDTVILSGNTATPRVIRDTVIQTKEVVREIPKEIVREVVKHDTVFKDREVVREIPKEVVREVVKRDTVRIASAPKEIVKEVFKTDTIFATKEVVREVPREVVREVVKRDTIRIASIPKEIVRRDTVFQTKEVVREVPKEVIREVIKRDTVRLAASEPLKIFIRDTIYKTTGEDIPVGPPGIGSVRFTPKPIYFAPNSTDPGSEADESIHYVIAFMREYPESIVEISGYGDSVGTPEANKIVTQRRTEAIAQRLIQAGVDPSRLVQRAYGKVLATLQDEKERRVEFKLLKLVRF
ncbi:MAG TPA: OmpA family protein [Patescibacteria group bacterium]|nr:OmpA family protein [Patescibacteria group bacterium]